MPSSRLIAFATGLAIALSPGTRVLAQDKGLPDIGSSAAELLTPKQEGEYGAYTLYMLRRYGYVLEDPLIDGWLDAVGHRLAAASDRPEQPFTFFMLRDRQINAFATLGGYVGVNAGTILAAEREDELAGVLAHEISHVTQRHVLRAVERAKKDQIPILLATLGVIVAAQQSGGNKTGYGDSAGNAVQAAVLGGQALAAQRQIDYTRSSETEADRFGIQALYNAGYDANGMGDFFARMDRLMRGDSGGYQTPAYLQTHPMTTTRLSEARDRAAKLQRNGPVVGTPAPRAASLLLPYGMSASAAPARTVASTHMFPWARERLRVLTARTPAQGVREAQAALDAAGAKASDEQRYALGLAQMRAGYPAAADAALQPLAARHPDNAWLGLALAENAFVAKDNALARKRYEQLLAARPDDRAVVLSYAETLNSIGDADAGKRAQSLLRPLLPTNGDNPLFQRNFARASELAGDTARAGEAYAEAAYLNGRAEDALNQLNGLLKRADLGYVQRARIEARIAAITPEVLDMKRRKIKPQDLPGDND